MIIINPTTTNVIFGNKESARVAITTKGNQITLQTIATKKQIGDSLEPKDIHDLPKVEMIFPCEESINQMIKALEKMKENYKVLNQLALAC